MKIYGCEKMKSNIVEKDAYEWFLWFKEECESEGIKNIDKIPELIRRSKEQNKSYKRLKTDFEEIKKQIIQIKVDKFNEGYNQAIKDYSLTGECVK